MRDTERSAKSYQGKWNMVLKAIDKHISMVSGMVLVNDNPQGHIQEHATSIDAKFETAEHDLVWLENTVPDFTAAPEVLQQVTENKEDEGKEDEEDEVEGEEEGEEDG
ncbi:hypothetical protein FRC11_003870 [Ceratobasidium sp. 423]|nr:hypothetical protein FRC11_003870 [Ceratobasidium sp. 423]